MIANLSRRERVLATLGVLAVVAALGWELGLQPVRERLRAAAELLPARAHALARRQELIGRKRAILAELDQSRARIDQASARFLTAATPAVAAAELQKIAKDIAAEASTEVRSERILPPVDRGELIEVSIEIAVSGDIRQLVDLLARLDVVPKLLLVQDVKVRVVNVSQPKELLATVALSGFIVPRKARS